MPPRPRVLDVGLERFALPYNRDLVGRRIDRYDVLVTLL